MVQAPFLPGKRHAVKIGVLVAFALLFAQTCALVHAYSHLHGNPSTHGVSGGSTGGSTQLCSDCLSFAPLLAAAGGSTYPPSVVRAEPDVVVCPIVAPVAGHTPSHAFQSRAPPTLV